MLFYFVCFYFMGLCVVAFIGGAIGASKRETSKFAITWPVWTPWFVMLFIIKVIVNLCVPKYQSIALSANTVKSNGLTVTEYVINPQNKLSIKANKLTNVK